MFFIMIRVVVTQQCLLVKIHQAVSLRLGHFIVIKLYLIFLRFIFFKFIYLFIFGCVGSSSLRRALSSCGKLGPLFIAVRGPLTIAASLVAEHRLQTCRLSSCGPRAQLLCGMRDPPRPGLEPVSPALAGRLPTTAPPGKPPKVYFKNLPYMILNVHPELRTSILYNC